MDFVVATVGFPAVFILLAAGWGLLVDRLAGRSLHGALILPVGYATVVVASQLLTRRDGLSDATPYVLLVGGIAGLVLGVARLGRLRQGVEPAIAFLVAYGVAIAPVLLLGRPTITAYLRDTTPGTHLAGAYGLIAHGASFAHEPLTSDGNQLRAYFDNAYPSGGHTALAGVGTLFETDLQWLFQPFLALCLALGAPALWLLARRLGLGRFLAVVAAAVACVPAITYAYALQGSVKEVALLPVLATIPALLTTPAGGLVMRWRAVVPLAVLAAAAIGAIGLASGPWVAAAFVIAAVAALVERGVRRSVMAAAREVAVPVVALIVLFGLLALPAVSNLASSFAVANNFSQSNAAAASDPGNLLGPLHAVQALGVWIGGDQRFLPDQHLNATYELIGITLLGVLFGVVALVRRRAWVTLAWLAAFCVIWWALTKKGTIWTDAKLLVLVAPTLVLMAFVGAASLARASRLAMWVLAGCVALGVLWSDAMLYHYTGLMPTSRYDEVMALDRQYAGRGPAWVPDFDEYLFSALRRTHIVGASYAYDPPEDNATAAGVGVPYGQSEDLDDAPLGALERVPLVIERNAPDRSRPPANYVLVHSGQWQVWQRRGPAPLAHLGVNSDTDATGVPRCADVRGIAATARMAGAQLLVARRPATIVRNLGHTTTSANWGRGSGGVNLLGPGRLLTSVRVPRSGTYKMWFKGDVTRPVTVQVDGRPMGSIGYQSGGSGSYVMPLTVRLSAGRHTVRMLRGGGTLHPGDGAPTNMSRLVLEPAGRPMHMDRVPASRWHALCGERVDWIEAVR